MTTLRLISLTSLLATVMACVNGCAEIVPGAAERIVMVPVEDRVQQLVAVHEAAHVVAQALLFGVDSVAEVHVHTETCSPYDPAYCCDMTIRKHYGAADFKGGGPFDDYGVEYHRRRVTHYLVGPMAERLVNRATAKEYDERKGIDEDIARAQAESIRKMLERARGVRGAIVPRRAKVGIPTVEEELELGRQRAERLVLANVNLIREIADMILVMLPSDGAHRIDGDGLRRIFRDHILIDPEKRLVRK